MDYGKYIIVEIGMIEKPIMFSSLISHDTFLRCFNKDSIVSAGFFVIDAEPSEKDISVSVFGESTTLNKKARNNKDERLLKRILRKE